MKFEIEVFEKQGVIDSKNAFLLGILNEISNMKIKHVKISKKIYIEIDTENEKEGIVELKKITQKVLYNPVIEDYKIKKI